MIADNYNSSTRIFRYIDFPQLMAMLFTKNLYFTKIARFPDRNECTDHNLINLANYLYKNNPNDNDAVRSVFKNSDSFNKVLNKVRGRLYANCWCANGDDYALWKIYTKGNPYGICIESTIGKVFESLLIDNSIFQLSHDRIDYIPNSVQNLDKLRRVVTEQSTDEIIKFLPFLKIPSYQYEQEYRFILYRKKNIHKDSINHSFKEGVNVRCDLIKLIATMHFSPFMPVWFKEAINKYMDELFDGNSAIRRNAMERMFHLGNIYSKSKIKENI